MPTLKFKSMVNREASLLQNIVEVIGSENDCSVKSVLVLSE